MVEKRGGRLGTLNTLTIIWRLIWNNGGISGVEMTTCDNIFDSDWLFYTNQSINRYL